MTLEHANDLMRDDLAKSGLVTEDIRARCIEPTERTACNIANNLSGYVIPYFDFKGKVIPFYRVRLFNSDPKYKQLKNNINHVYFPPNFLNLLRKSKDKIIIVTEGEKKAALLCKHGYPTIAFGGVDSWKNKSLILPKDTEFVQFKYNKEMIKAKLPTDSSSLSIDDTDRASGFREITEYALHNGYKFMIVYDSDLTLGVKPQVQRAAASLGYELRFLGFSMDSIKQLILPTLHEENMSLDDYIMHERGGLEAFQKIYQKTRDNPRSFPRHPNIREYMGKKLQATGKLSRKEMKNVSLSLIAEMDSTGYRLYNKAEDNMYFFNMKSSRLMRVDVNSNDKSKLQNTPFGRMLYRDYGISPAADTKLMHWLGAQFSGEEPVGEVNPHRVIARPSYTENCCRFQISDGHFVKVSAQDIEIKQNGSEGILFEADRVEDLDLDKFKRALKELQTQPVKMWWNDVLETTRLKDRGHHQQLLALLYYISPWLYRWRGTQLPVEIVIGESGSGKSSLCELRLSIQTGRADLKNAPEDIKGWHTAISNNGGLHVTDNVQLLNKALRTTLSDEVCRLVTEPEPHVEMRKYFTNADQMRLKVDNVFCFTAIAQPFMASDLLQRAVIVEFDKHQTKEVSYDSNWKETQLNKFGGREYWLAHHFIVLQRFFQAVQKHWNHNYKAKHRLINFEQSIIIMAKHVFNIDTKWIQQKLAYDVNKAVATNDWALEGLTEFAQERWGSIHKDKEFSTKDIVTWAERNADYADCVVLINARKLGIYIANSKHIIAEITGIEETAKRANKMHYRLSPEKFQS